LRRSLEAARKPLVRGRPLRPQRARPGGRDPRERKLMAGGRSGP
jgi:hypothetical protein